MRHYQRLKLLPGASHVVEFELTAHDFATTDTSGGEVVREGQWGLVTKVTEADDAGEVQHVIYVE